ncbi:unnamed protein product [Anisakis simplex]|uniref:Sialin n=1 Tax=Anisakis simplex TaxID=6269 RepID=A0A0M3KDM4_ANISI|nr:unnamed protein product [Anisakis simplex]
MSDQASNNNVITIQSSDYSKIDSESIETADVYSTPPNELNYELMSDIHGSKHDSDSPMPNDRVTFQSDLHNTNQSNNVCAMQCHDARSELDSELKTNENDFEMSSTQPQVIEVVGEDEQIDLSNKFVNNVHCNTDNDEQKCFDQTIANNLPNRASTISQDGDNAKEKNAPKRKLTYHGAETDWPQVRLISSILFLGCIQMFVIGMSEWPYMQQVDKQATSTFFGYVGSVSALGHAICAPLMGYWSSATGQTKYANS